MRENHDVEFVERAGLARLGRRGDEQVRVGGRHALMERGDPVLGHGIERVFKEAVGWIILNREMILQSASFLGAE